MTRINLSVIPVWVLSLVAVIIIGLTTGPSEHLTWVSVALAGAVIVTFAIQLAIQRKEGFVVRAMVSIGGAIVIFAIATAVFAVIG